MSRRRLNKRKRQPVVTRDDRPFPLVAPGSPARAKATEETPEQRRLSLNEYLEQLREANKKRSASR